MCPPLLHRSPRPTGRGRSGLSCPAQSTLVLCSHLALSLRLPSTPGPPPEFLGLFSRHGLYSAASPPAPHAESRHHSPTIGGESKPHFSRDSKATAATEPSLFGATSAHCRVGAAGPSPLWSRPPTSDSAFPGTCHLPQVPPIRFRLSLFPVPPVPPGPAPQFLRPEFLRGVKSSYSRKVHLCYALSILGFGNSSQFSRKPDCGWSRKDRGNLVRNY